MNLNTSKWIINNLAADLTILPAGTDDVVSALCSAGIYNFVDISDYECSFAWRFGEHCRRWQVAMPEPDKMTLRYLREFCLYEFVHGRKVALCVRQVHLKPAVAETLLAFFGSHPGDDRLGKLMRAQQGRMLGTIFGDAGKTGCDASRVDKYSLGDFVCHATDAEAAKHIILRGQILSARQARGLPGHVLAMESRNAAGDPADYFDYVMFGPATHPGLHELVNERLLGRPPSWAEMESGLTPAVRFFFRRQDVLRHRGFCCDGIHEKVRDAMELAPLLAAVLIPGDVPNALELKTELRKVLPAVSVLELCRDGDGPEAWATRITKALACLP